MSRYRVVGESVVTQGAWEKATGHARYAVDVSCYGMLMGKILRSPYPHARIVNIDASQAERLSGVKAVIVGGLPEKGSERKEALAMRPGKERIFALDKVRYIGEEVAAVAAISEDIAEEALELITVEYEELPAYFDPLDAVKTDAVKIHDSEGNIAAAFNFTRGDPEKGFQQADLIFEDTFKIQMQNQGYLEPLSCLTEVDSSGKLKMWVAHMDPSGVRLGLARALHLSESKVRVIQTCVGGAYGGKVSLMPMHTICALLAMKANRPVKIVYSREEEFTAGLPRLSASIYLRIGIKKDGTLLAKETKIIADNGAYIVYGPRILSQMMVTQDCLYRIKNIKAEGKAIYTNKTPTGAMRGFGTIHMAFAQETVLERIACELGIDPAELRLKNAVQPGDVTAHGWEIHSCGLSECIQEVTHRIGWKEKEKGRDGRRGLGLACVAYDIDTRQDATSFGGSLAYVEILEDGKVKVISGESDCGQGWNTVAAQIAAEVLGIPYEDVQVTIPDTDFTPYSNGPWGLRITVSGGSAVKLAAEDAKKKLMELAANYLEANLADLEMKDGKIFIRDTPQNEVTMAELAKRELFRKGGSAIIGRGLDEPPNTVPRHRVTLYGNTSRAYNFGAQAAEVEVDRQTGQVKVLRFVSAHDVGKAINPISCEGQIEGSIVCGLGFATTEEVIWKTGQVLNPNFTDYRMLTTSDIPMLEPVLIETLDPNTPFGAKSIGQPAIMGVAPAIANAIFDATGIKVNQLPITANKILAGLGETHKGGVGKG
jgi:CO/xanthine dehydrogenase Mo-binding subunit